MAFDLVYLNGKNLCGEPLSRRKELLHRILTPKEGYVMLAEYAIGRTAQDIVSAANKAILNGEEGIVMKRASSYYKPDGRKVC